MDESSTCIRSRRGQCIEVPFVCRSTPKASMAGGVAGRLPMASSPLLPTARACTSQRHRHLNYRRQPISRFNIPRTVRISACVCIRFLYYQFAFSSLLVFTMLFYSSLSVCLSLSRERERDKMRGLEETRSESKMVIFQRKSCWIVAREHSLSVKFRPIFKSRFLSVVFHED